MIENIQQYLIDKYPNVYFNGIRCGAYFPEEWLPIIEELSHNISLELSINHNEDFAVDQIKEKFGGLRFYVSASNEKIDQFIVEAEKKVDELEKKIRENR